MNLTDNFLFGAAMDNEKSGQLIAETILKTLFHRDIKITRINPEKTFWPPSEKFHGVRLDAYIEEGSAEVLPGNVYDLEPDNKSNQKKCLPRRSRFYHSSIDSRLLRSGKSYDDLSSVWMIFITTFDPFGEDRMVYTVRNHCIELPEMEYDDGAVTLFLYVKGTKGNPPEDLKILLRYLSDTTAENACTRELSQIQNCIDELKRDPGVGRQFMDWREYIELERREAVEEQKAQNEALKKQVDAEKNRADSEKDRADAEKDRADSEKDRADSEKKRADEAEAEVLRLKALLASNGVNVESNWTKKGFRTV